MKRFLPEQLERAVDLHEHVESRRWDLDAVSERERTLTLELWGCKARALLEDVLQEPDRQACLWTLGVVKAIAYKHGIYIHALGRHHHDDWALRARSAAARLRARQRREESTAPAADSPKVVEISPPAVEESAPHFSQLAGMTVLVIGGVKDNVVLDRYRNADFTLEWTPWDLRQVQSAVRRIRQGHVGAAIFLTDLNRHAAFNAVREACRLSATPLILGTRGAAGIQRALELLDQQLGKQPA